MLGRAGLAQAVQVDPRAWEVHAELGLILLGVNRPGAARAHLERAYEGDPYNALTVKLIIDHYPVESIRKRGQEIERVQRGERESGDQRHGHDAVSPLQERRACGVLQGAAGMSAAPTLSETSLPTR